MELWLAGLTLVGLIGALVFSRVHATVLFLIAALFCLVAGLVSIDTFWSKTTNEGLVTLVLLILCAVALERLPWLGMLSRLVDSPRLSWSVVRIVAIAAPMSAVLNNTAVVASLANVLRRSEYHASSRLLLPLSYAAILGGTLTLIGTSTNLIVSSFLEDQRGVGLGFGDFFVISAPVVLLVGCLLVILARRLPTRENFEANETEYTLEAEVDEAGALVGKTVEVAGLRALETLYLAEILRDGRRIKPVSPTDILLSGDRLVFTGDVSDVARIDHVEGLSTFAKREGLMQSELTEVIVAPGSILDGRSAKSLGFRARFNAAIVAVQRDGQHVEGRLGELPLRAGDLLVLATGDDFAERKNLSRNFILLSDSLDVRLMDSTAGFLATAALLVVIVMAALGTIPLSLGLLLLLVGFWAADVVSVDDLRRRFPFDIWILVSSALVVADAMIESQLVASFVGSAMPLLSGSPPFLGLVLVFVLTLILTELITNNAAAALMFPIGYALAEASGVDVMPFALAVAFAASGSFLTPYGYATNLIVQNIAGYTRGDYLRFGYPITLAYTVGVLAMLHAVYFAQV
ncbi:MAG: SLC13 family permease [Halieaceae bacterium]